MSFYIASFCVEVVHEASNRYLTNEVCHNSQWVWVAMGISSMCSASGSGWPWASARCALPGLRGRWASALSALPGQRGRWAWASADPTLLLHPDGFWVTERPLHATTEWAVHSDSQRAHTHTHTHTHAHKQETTLQWFTSPWYFNVFMGLCVSDDEASNHVQ